MSEIEEQLQIKINLFNCKGKNKYSTVILTLMKETVELLIPTNKLICREACFTIDETNLPLFLKNRLQNTSGVFTMRENKEFLNSCNINGILEPYF